jgi:hypothetical protein
MVLWLMCYGMFGTLWELESSKYELLFGLGVNRDRNLRTKFDIRVRRVICVY